MFAVFVDDVQFAAFDVLVAAAEVDVAAVVAGRKLHGVDL